MNDGKNLEVLLSAAITVAVESMMENVDEKIQAAVNLGATVGAAVGAQIGAAAAVKAIEDEKKNFRDKEYGNRLRNTKTLLKHYRELERIATAEGENDDSEKCPDPKPRNNKLRKEREFLSSVKSSRARTKAVMEQFDKILRIYKTACLVSEKPEDPRHWRVIEALYISPSRISPEQVAQAESIDIRTVYKDVNACVSDLSSLLYGLNGIKFL